MQESATWNALASLLCGGVAGCCAKTVVAPFDRVKVLLQGHHVCYNDLKPLSALKRVYVADGFWGYYQGNGAQMLRIFPYAAIQFKSYGYYKQVSRNLNMTFDGGYEKLICGSLAGLTAATATYPLDVVRTRLAFQQREIRLSAKETDVLAYRGIVDALRKMVLFEGGVRALYKGLSATLLGMVPYAGISFFTFERLKQWSLSNVSHNWLITQTTLKDSSSNEMRPGPPRLALIGRLICGGVAGLVAQSASYPLDVTRRMMQLSKQTKANEPWHLVLIRIFRTHGFRQGIYRGLTLNYIRVVPMVSTSFTVYETVSHHLGLDLATDS